MLNRILDIYETLVLGHPKKVLAFMTTIMICAAIQIPNLFIETSSDTLVLEGDHDLQYYQQARDRYPEREFLLVSYAPKRGDLLDVTNLRRMTALVDELDDVEGVHYINSMLDVPLLTVNKDTLGEEGATIPTLRGGNVDLNAARREFRESSLYKGLVSDENLSVAAIQLLLKENKAYNALFARREDLRRERRLSGLNKEQTAELEKIEATYKEETVMHQANRNMLIANVRGVLDHHRDHAEIFVGGVPMITADMVRYVRNDLIVFGLATGLTILLLLILIFRDWRWAFVPLLCCAMVCMFTMGFLIWLDWTMNIVSANYLLLLFILTLAVNVHLIVRYRELHAAMPDASHQSLIGLVIRQMLTPCTYMVMTTVVSFVSLYFSQVRPVIDFGMMMALTCVILLTWSFLVFPSALMLCSQPKVEPSVIDYKKSFTRYLAIVVEKLGAHIVWIYIAVAATGVYGISQLKVESRFIDYFAKDTEIHQGMAVIDEYLGGTIPLEILITMPTQDSEDDEDAFDFGDDQQAQVSPWMNNYGLKTVKQVHDYMDSLPESGKVLSLGVLYDIMSDHLGRPPDDVELAVFTKSLPPDIHNLLVRSYLSEDGHETRIALRVKETSRDLERAVFIHKVRTDLRNMLNVPDENIHMTGLLILYNNLLQSLYRSQILTLGVVMLVIFFMFWALFRSAAVAAISILPNFLAASLILGLMGLIGLPLDMVTVIIAALVIGIGVDDTVHYVWRFKNEFAVRRNYIETMHVCHGSVGRAISYTSIVIVAGLMLLVLSNFTPSIRFGVLTSLAMVIALIGTMVLLPQMFRMIQPFGPEVRSKSSAQSK